MVAADIPSSIPVTVLTGYLWGRENNTPQSHSYL